MVGCLQVDAVVERVLGWDGKLLDRHLMQLVMQDSESGWGRRSWHTHTLAVGNRQYGVGSRHREPGNHGMGWMG
jgi:hypothetical protein